ncbi:MAG TPA: hypothetical protein DFR83_29455, partial [Deltaproteobacteria bacterium]|nr:hypothetical protein [Deltaproteobacteria bacterium]
MTRRPAPAIVRDGARQGGRARDSVTLLVGGRGGSTLLCLRQFPSAWRRNRFRVVHKGMRCVFATVALVVGCGSDPASDGGPSAGQLAWVDPASDDDWSHLIDEAEGSEPLSAADVEPQLNAALALGIPNA